MQVTRWALVKARLVPYGAALVPEQFTVDIDGEDLPGLVTVDIRVDRRHGPQVSRLALTATHGGAVTPAKLRALRLPPLISTAMQAVSLRPVVAEDGAILGGKSPGPAVDAELRTHRYQQVDEAHLRSVAAVYKAASRFPTKAVAETFGTSRPTAARWVMAARAAGFLPEAKHTKGQPS